jgi:hypothetical protein
MGLRATGVPHLGAEIVDIVIGLGVVGAAPASRRAGVKKECAAVSLTGVTEGIEPVFALSEERVHGRAGHNRDP